MTDTLQPLPAWMTYSSSVVTLPDGEVQTSYTILQLPLTYYGPSIPLGTDWIYGGLTSPASEPTPSTTSSFTTTSPPATPTPTSTAIPSSSTATPSSSSSIVTPTSTGQSTSTQSQSFSMTSSPSVTVSSMSTMSTSSSSGSPATSSAVPAPSGNNSGLSHNSIIAIICGSIAGALILLVLMLLCCILIRRQRTRGRQYMISSPPMSFLRAIPSSLSSLGSSYVFLGQDRTNSRGQRDSRQPGVGSPRHSGEEEDAFLVPRRGALAAGDDKSGSSAHSRASVWAVGPDGTHVRIWSSRGTEEVDLQTDMDTTVVGDNSHPHAYFASADHLAAPGAAAAFVSAGQGLPEKQVYEKAAAPSSSDLHEEFGGLQLLNVPHQSMASRRPLSVDSGVSLDPHSPAQFMFAHRVQVADPRIPSASSPPEERRALIGEPSPIGHANSQGSWNPLSNLSRLSGWGFLRTEAQSSRPASPGSLLSRTPKSKRSQASVRNPSSLGHHTEEDDDSRVGLLASGSTSPPLVHPRFQQLNTMAEDRPNSSISGRSGGSSAYLTAQESPIVSSMGSRNASIPSVPTNAMGSTQLPIRAPPTARTPPVTTTRYAHYPVPSDQPPAYATTDPATPGGAMDILDLPVPMPVPTFASSTSRRPPTIQLPPGLFDSGLPAPRVWTDLAGSSNGGTPLSPIASVSVSNESDDMTVPDLLDAAPPRAAEVWRSLADARDRGTRASTAQPTLVHPGIGDRRQSYNVSVHAGSNATGSASSRSAATQLSPLSEVFLTSPMAAAHAPVRNPSPPLSAVGHAGGFNQPALRAIQPLVIRRSGSDLSGPAVSYHSAGSSSFGSSAEGHVHSGQEGAASLTAFGPPQPGMFMSRNPYAPLTQTAPHSTIRLVGTTPPNGANQDRSYS